MSRQEEIARAADTLWDFHCIYDDLQAADAIVGLGSYDLRVADRCAELFQGGLAPTVLLSGASGNWTQGLYDGSEARAFATRCLAQGVPPDAIVLEEEASNIGENIVFASRLLPKVRSVILVTKPQTQRRCSATAAKFWPSVEHMTTASVHRRKDQTTEAFGEHDLIAEMVGDLARLKTYPARGFQIPVAISEDVEAAFTQLVDAGFTGHMP